MPARKHKVAEPSTRIPTKRLSNGFEIAALGLGTWTVGGKMQRDPENDDAGDVLGIRNALSAGITHIDTAEMYAGGHAEELVGEAIKGRERAGLFIASKVMAQNLRYEDVLRSARKSLERLGTDYLDLYLIHWPNRKIPLEETMKAMDELVGEGLVKNIGVSNFSVESLERAQACAENRIVCNQVHYNLIVREPERKGLLAYCQKKGVMLVAYRPVQKGELAKPGVAVIDELCRKYGKTPAQIAINWLVSQKNVVTIAKMGDPGHLRENLGALGWSLEKGDIERLRAEYPDQRAVSEVGPLS